MKERKKGGKQKRKRIKIKEKERKRKKGTNKKQVQKRRRVGVEAWPGLLHQGYGDRSRGHPRYEEKVMMDQDRSRKIKITQGNPKRIMTKKDSKS